MDNSAVTAGERGGWNRGKEVEEGTVRINGDGWKQKK